MSQPDRLGRYAVRRRIGAGGFATVWLCYDEHLDSPVAVKVLAENWAEDHHVRGRFLEEGRFLRKVDSPHVVPVYDAGQLDDGRPFLVMAYADQGNLVDRLSGGPLTLGAALSVIRQIAQGLRALHTRNVLHRDLKPANVLFRTAADDDGEVRAMVGDLGLGKALDMSSRLTMIGGTPSYVSPEQARGENLDPRSDVYSLGVLAYQLLTGRQPYSHASLLAAAEPVPPPPMGDHLPAGLEPAVRRAMSPRREDRWSSALGFAEALAAGAAADPAGLGVPLVGPIPADLQRTQPGARPTPYRTLVAGSPGAVAVGGQATPGETEAPELGWGSSTGGETPGRRTTPAGAPRSGLRRLGWVAAALALSAGAGLGGYSAFARIWPTVKIDEGTLSVEVPRAWRAHSSLASWTPQGADSDSPSLSAGASGAWNSGGSADPGVFLGIMPADHLVDQLPGHPECERSGRPVLDTIGLGPASTVTSAGCPGGTVMIERVVEINQSQLLWVQVRAKDMTTANEILDSVRVRGT